MISFEGTVSKVIYSSKNYEEYRIFELGYGSDKVKVKGYLPCVHTGFHLSGQGDPEESEKYGREIVIKKVQIELPTDPSGIERYCKLLLGRADLGKTTVEDDNTSSEEELDDELISEYAIADFHVGELCDSLGKSVLDQIANNFDYVYNFVQRKGWLNEKDINPPSEMGDQVKPWRCVK